MKPKAVKGFIKEQASYLRSCSLGIGIKSSILATVYSDQDPSLFKFTGLFTKF